MKNWYAGRNIYGMCTMNSIGWIGTWFNTKKERDEWVDKDPSTRFALTRKQIEEMYNTQKEELHLETYTCEDQDGNPYTEKWIQKD